jgi:hypothetical protein
LSKTVRCLGQGARQVIAQGSVPTGHALNAIQYYYFNS